jgi:HSP90 family molecular chaperone
MSKETHQFQAEITKLLDLFAKSLYTHKEVFLRELISNSSDALSKIKFELLQNKNILDADKDLEINITIDKDNKKLTISDNGVGMTKEELISNLGTIAKSGTIEYLKNLADKKPEESSLIGQFGVGFYSVFMVAEKVVVETRSYQPDSKAYKWTADGSGEYVIEDSDMKNRGTSITIILKDEDKEYLEKQRIEGIIKRYSNFVPFPVKVEGEKSNEVTALWTEPKNNITDEQYKEFYKFATDSYDDPMYYQHITADVPVQFRAILYIPKINNSKLFGYMNKDYGPSLYSNKVLIIDQCKDLLPPYLDFIKGVVDTEDVPLNVSRETLQDNRNLIKIKKVLTKKMLDFFTEKAKEDPEQYKTFWNEFGMAIKQGISSDFENRDRIAELLRFNSSFFDDGNGLTSLSEYVSRMNEDQKEIYYISGENRDAVDRNPHIEIFKKNGIEVLYLYDPADDFVLSGLNKYKDKDIKSIDQANLDSLEKDDKSEKKSEEEINKLDNLVSYVKELLKDKTKDVRKSSRLTDSPVCLVNPDNTTSTQMQKIMKMLNESFEIPKKIFEINYDSELIKNLAEIHHKNINKEYLDNCVMQLFDNALMLDGFMNQPSTMIPRLNQLMEEGTKKLVKE